jgi:hypothetical protein
MRTTNAVRRMQWLCLALGCLLTTAATAQSPRAPTIEQLQAELERRDAIIADLLQRVQALEGRIGTPPGAPQVPAAAPRAAATSSAPHARTQADEAADEALLERALERSLVLSGGALIPKGQREIEPSLGYDYTQRSGLVIVGSDVVARSLRKEDYTGALAFRAGLPWTSQLDIALPYTWQRIETVVAGTGGRSTDSGVGDIQIGLTKQFLDERESRFALLGGVTYVHSSNHDSLRGLALGLPDFATPAGVGIGHEAIIARGAATKRLDPLVFVGSLSYAWNRGENVDGFDVRVGNTAGGSLRAILAASPDVSLRAGVSFARTGKSSVNGFGLEGSRTTASVLELGTSVVLGRNMLLDVSLGVGLTSDSPDFLLGVSLPIRF